jgi:hypothetical protein
VEGEDGVELVPAEIESFEFRPESSKIEKPMSHPSRSEPAHAGGEGD